MSISLHPLYEGTFSVGTDRKFNPIARTDPPAKGALKLSIYPFLIKTGERNILFDAGIGDLFGGDTTIETMFHNLEQHNLSNLDITDVFISHLHFDHFAGVANRLNGFWELTFPNAAIWVSEDAWQELTDNSDELSETRQEFISFLEFRADIQYLRENEYAIPGVRSKTVGGHTQYHQILYFEEGNHNYLMAGDILEGRVSINRSYAAKYDFDPKKTMDIRNRLQQVAYEKEYSILAYHETDHPVFRLTDFDEKKGYKIESTDL